MNTPLNLDAVNHNRSHLEEVANVIIAGYKDSLAAKPHCPPGPARPGEADKQTLYNVGFDIGIKHRLLQNNWGTPK